MKNKRTGKSSYRASSELEFVSNLFDNAEFVNLESQKRDSLKTYLDDPNNHVIYVFDTSVITSFCAPWMSGPLVEKTGQGGHGQIMPLEFLDHLSSDQHIKTRLEERDTATNVARVLANFAFRNIQPQSFQNSIFQLPSHFEETMRVYKAVKDKVDRVGEPPGKADKRLERDILNSMVLLNANGRMWYENSVLSLEYLTSSLVSKLIDRSLSKRSEVREWDNFYNLNTRFNGLFSTEEISFSQTNIKKHTISKSNLMVMKDIIQVSHEENGPVKDTLTKYESKFYKFLKSKQSLLPWRKSLSEDARALAALFYINEKMQQNNIPCRMVLITGDQNLTTTVSEGVEVKSILGEKFSSEFGFKYVHHIWSLIDEIAPTRKKLSKKKLFSGLLAYQEYSLDDGLSMQKDIDRAVVEWKDFANQANIDSYTIEYGVQKTGEKNQLRDEIFETVKIHFLHLKNWKQVQNAVNETVLRARDRANVSFSDIGADALVQANQSGTRNPPDLMFDSLVNTDNIFKNLASPEKIYKNADEFGKDFDLIKEDCHDSSVDKDDLQEVHLKYLVLGALFASANRWSIAEQHSEHAIEIIERTGWPDKKLKVKHDSTSIMSGREAWYLRAAARHIRATRQNDFKKALIYLSESEERWKYDQKHGSAKNVPKIRFQNERLAIKLDQYYFQRERSSSNKEIKILYCDKAALQISTAFKEVMKEIRCLKSSIGAKHHDSYINDIQPGTRVAIATNVIQCAVIHKFRELKNLPNIRQLELSMKDLGDAVNEIYEHTNIVNKIKQKFNSSYEFKVARHPSVICSALTLRYAAAGAMLLNYEPLKYWTPNKSEDVEKLFQDDSDITKYDQWRFQQLKVFIDLLKQD